MTKKSFILFFIFMGTIFIPLTSFGISPPSECAEHWWCKGCGLAYPASQKVCLNKDCPYYRQPRKR